MGGSSSKKTNAKLQVEIVLLLRDIVLDLKELIPKLESNAEDGCAALKKISGGIEELLDDPNVTSKSTLPMFLVSLQLLKKLKNEVLKKLGEVCCSSPAKAKECASLAAQVVTEINEFSPMLEGMLTRK